MERDNTIDLADPATRHAVEAAEARIAEVRAQGRPTLIDTISQGDFEAWDGSGEMAIVGTVRA